MGCDCDTKNPKPPLTVDQTAGTAPCENTQSEGPCAPGNCCNYFKFASEANGTSFVFSAGGPFRIRGNGTFFCDGYECPRRSNPPQYLEALNPPISPFLDPGPLTNAVCIDLVKGSYLAEARVSVHNAVPGTRVIFAYRPDCTDSTVEYSVCDCIAQCPDWECLEGSVSYNHRDPVDFDCCCDMVVPVSNCRPAFRFLVLPGCPQPGVTSPSAPEFVDNLQFSMLRLTSRDIVNCGGNDLLNHPVNFAWPPAPAVHCD